MGLHSGGLIIGRIFASEIWAGGGGLFSGGLIFFLGGGLIIGILRYSISLTPKNVKTFCTKKLDCFAVSLF